MTLVKKKLETNSIIDMISRKVQLSDKVEGEFITYLFSQGPPKMWTEHHSISFNETKT